MSLKTYALTITIGILFFTLTLLCMANTNRSSTICRTEIATNYDDDYWAICLGQHVNKSQPDCGYVFCYQCLFDWCKIKLECPSCKTPFSIFYHSMHSPEGWQICIPENPLVSDDGPSGHFVVLNTPMMLTMSQTTLNFFVHLKKCWAILTCNGTIQPQLVPIRKAIMNFKVLLVRYWVTLNSAKHY